LIKRELFLRLSFFVGFISEFNFVKVENTVFEAVF